MDLASKTNLVIKAAVTGDPNDDFMDESTVEGPGVKVKTMDSKLGDPHNFPVDTSKVGSGMSVHGDVRNSPDNTAAMENSVMGLEGRSCP